MPVDLTVATRAIRSARQAIQIVENEATKAARATEAALRTDHERRVEASRNAVLGRIRAWTELSDRELADKILEAATATVNYRVDRVDVSFDIKLPVRLDWMDAHLITGMLRSRGIEVYLRESFDGKIRCHIASDAPPAVLEALGVVTAAAKERSGYDAKSTAADGLVPFVHAYISGAPPPCSIAAMKEGLASRLPPDLEDSIAGMARGTLEDDIRREMTSTSGTLWLEVPIRGTYHDDILDLVACRVNVDVESVVQVGRIIGTRSGLYVSFFLGAF